MTTLFRKFFLCGIILSLGLLTACNNTKGGKVAVTPILSFGLIADCQYCNVVGEGQRKYSHSDAKLKACVDDFNTMDLSWVIHLGDFIDKDWESFNVVAPIYDQLKMPGYHVLGNHDFSVVDSLKGDVSTRMGLPAPYYHFTNRGWRFVVLDGNDVSFHAYPEESSRYRAAEKYYSTNKISSPKWNGALGARQMEWLEETLEDAMKKDEGVILFCHFPVFPENKHNLWNAAEVVDLLENYSNVKAYINGHNHDGNYAEKNGIHYLTMKGMVDTEVSSYGVMSIEQDRLVLEGTGREEDRVLKFNKK